jgi:cell pole-organizing protein PopZ
MTQPAKSQEPSMEEILASIRRIIADDDANKAQARPAAEVAKAPAPAPRPATPPPRMPIPPARPAAPPPLPPVEQIQQTPIFESALAAPEVDPGHVAVDDGPGSDILDLTESMTAARPHEPAPPQPSPPPVATAAPAPGFRTINAQPDVIFDDEPSPSPARPSADSFAHAMTEARGEHELLSSSASAAVDSAFGTLASSVLTQNSRTLEDLVREMLRPMLKAWLDDNLPGLVERLVRAEIERVSRGRTG